MATANDEFLSSLASFLQLIPWMTKIGREMHFQNRHNDASLVEVDGRRHRGRRCRRR